MDITDLFAFPKPGDAGKSIVIMDVHPSFGVAPPGPTTSEPFAPEALYELKVDTNGDLVAEIAYRVRFSPAGDGALTATVRRVEGPDAAGMSEGGEIIMQGAPVSTGREAQVTEAGAYRFFAGWRAERGARMSIIARLWPVPDHMNGLRHGHRHARRRCTPPAHPQHSHGGPTAGPAAQRAPCPRDRPRP